jgi:hypothetical protein
MPSVAQVVGQTIGGDPEIFLKSLNTNKVIPSCGLIGGTKGGGLPIPGAKESRALWLEDNVALEVNFHPCANGPSWDYSLSEIRSCLVRALQPKGLGIEFKSALRFPKEMLLSEKAQVFGCDPDFDAYESSSDKLAERKKIDPSDVGTYRFAGGHIHLGFANPHNIPLNAVAIMLDMFIGLPSLFHDNQGPRRAFYGKAGLFRPKKYGIEYRTMGNWWVHPEAQESSGMMAREALRVANCFDNYPEELSTIFEKTPLMDVREIINTENKKEARILYHSITGSIAAARLGLGDYFRVG